MVPRNHTDTVYLKYLNYELLIKVVTSLPITSYKLVISC